MNKCISNKIERLRFRPFPQHKYWSGSIYNHHDISGLNFWWPDSQSSSNGSEICSPSARSVYLRGCIREQRQSIFGWCKQFVASKSLDLRVLIGFNILVCLLECLTVRYTAHGISRDGVNVSQVYVILADIFVTGGLGQLETTLEPGVTASSAIPNWTASKWPTRWDNAVNYISSKSNRFDSFFVGERAKRRLRCMVFRVRFETASHEVDVKWQYFS